jgi:DNA-binding transcriptional MerR regulator
VPHDQHHARRSDDDLLTIQEVSALLRTPVATLRYWRYLGIGPHSFKIGRRVFYRASDLYAWIDAQHDKHHGPTAA